MGEILWVPQQLPPVCLSFPAQAQPCPVLPRPVDPGPSSGSKHPHLAGVKP